MADLRFSNQGPIVLGLGGSYPNYASIPTVFGGPTQGILISVYNRGGAYVPNTAFNTSIPTTIGLNNPVDWSDYYTTSNYNPGPTPVPPIPNPRPTPGPTPDTTVIPNIVAPQAAYIGNTVTLGSLTTKGVGVVNPYTCSSVTVDGITTPNVALDPTNIQFVVQGGMNFDPANRSDVLINIPSLSSGINVPKWFARYALNYSLYGTLSNTSAMTGQQVLISNLLSLQTSPPPTVTIGGVTQTIVSITPHDTIQNDILFEVSSNTPTEDSNIVITNAKGDSVTLPQQFKRTTGMTPTDPIDRGPPPNIDWTAQEQIPETLNFTFTSDLAFAAGTTFPTLAQPIIGGDQNQTTAALDPDMDLQGNQNNVPATSDFQLVQNTTSVTLSGQSSLFFVQIGSLSSSVVIPAGSTNFIDLTMTFSAPVGAIYEGQLTVLISNNNQISTSFGVVTEPVPFSTRNISYNSGTGLHSVTIRYNLPATFTFAYTLFAANTPVYAYIARNFSGQSFVKADGSTFTFPVDTYWYNTYLNVPIAEPTAGFVVCEALKFVDPVSNLPTYYLCMATPTQNSYEFEGMIIRIDINNTNLLNLPYFWKGQGQTIQPVDTTTQFLPSSSLNRPCRIFGFNVYLTQNIYAQQFLNIGYKCLVGNNLYVSYGPGFVFNLSTRRSVNGNLSYFGSVPWVTRTRTSALSKFYMWNNIPYFIGLFFWNFNFGANNKLLLINLNDLTTLNLPAPSSGGPQFIENWLNICDTQLVFAARIGTTFTASLYYMPYNSVTPIMGSSALIVSLTSPNVGVFPIIYGDPTSGYYVTDSPSSNTYRTRTTNQFLDYPPAVSWTFNRSASATYTALNLPISLSPTATNAQRAQSVASLLVSQWNGPNTPTYTITTDMSGNTVLTFNTNNTTPSNSTLTQTGTTTAGMFTLTTSGGSSGSANNITRLEITGAPTGGPVYVGSSYGYINNLTFTHDGNSFSSTSAVIPNVNQPSNIREVYNF